MINKFKTFLLIFSISLGAYSQPQVIDKVIGIVGKNILKQSELEAQFAQFLSQGVDATVNTRCDLYEQLLYQKLLLAQAQKDSVEVSDNQVETELERRLKVYIGQFGSREKFEEFYGKSVELFKEELRETLRDLMLAQTMQSKIVTDVNISPNEVKEFFNSIPTDSLPFINAEVEVGQIIKKAPVNAEAKKEAKEKIESLRERVLKGEDFALLARLYSEDPGSAKNGGEYKNMGRGQFVPEFESMAFSMKEGETSPVFETEFGFHILQTIQRRGEVVDVRHLLIIPKITAFDLEKARLLLDSVYNLIKKDSISFSDAAGKFSDDEETKNSGGLIVDPRVGSSKIEMNMLSQVDPTIFYSVDKLKVGEVSAPVITTTRDSKQAYRLVYLKSRTEPHRANLKDDYQRMQTEALQRKQQKVINEWIIRKLQVTYVKIGDDFKTCTFNNNWLKL
jgi:peptidyl-prolyl cis-trans isomerase SurA